MKIKLKHRKQFIKKLKGHGIFYADKKGKQEKVHLLKNQELIAAIEKHFGKLVNYSDNNIYKSFTEWDIERRAKERGEKGIKKHVYIIGNTSMGFCKIGNSYDPYERLKGIQTGCPYHVEVLAIFEGDEKTEKALHKKYAKYRMKGEWFRIEGGIKETLNRK